MNLPNDIQILIVLYAAEPIYKLNPCDKEHHADILSASLGNPRAIRWIKKNFGKILDRSGVLKNPHPTILDILLKNEISEITHITYPELFNTQEAWKEYFDECKNNSRLYIAFSKCPYMDIILENSKYITDDELKRWLSSNVNPEIINFLLTNPDFINWDIISSNDFAGPIIKKYPRYVKMIDDNNDSRLIENTCTEAIEHLKLYGMDHFDTWSKNAAMDPYNIEWVIENMHLYYKANGALKLSYGDPDLLQIFKNPNIFEYLSNDKISELFEKYIYQSNHGHSSLCSNQSPKLIGWARAHIDILSCIDIYTIASNNIHWFQNLYGSRYVRAVRKFLF